MNSCYRCPLCTIDSMIGATPGIMQNCLFCLISTSNKICHQCSLENKFCCICGEPIWMYAFYEQKIESKLDKMKERAKKDGMYSSFIQVIEARQKEMKKLTLEEMLSYCKC